MILHVSILVQRFLFVRIALDLEACPRLKRFLFRGTIWGSCLRTGITRHAQWFCLKLLNASAGGTGLCENRLLCVTFNFGQRSWFPCRFVDNSNPLSFPGKNSYHRHFFKRPCGIKYFEKNARSYAHDQAEVKIEKSYPWCYPMGHLTQIEHSMATSQI